MNESTENSLNETPKNDFHASNESQFSLSSFTASPSRTSSQTMDLIKLQKKQMQVQKNCSVRCCLNWTPIGYFFLLSCLNGLGIALTFISITEKLNVKKNTELWVLLILSAVSAVPAFVLLIFVYIASRPRDFKWKPGMKTILIKLTWLSLVIGIDIWAFLI